MKFASPNKLFTGHQESRVMPSRQVVSFRLRRDGIWNLETGKVEQPCLTWQPPKTCPLIIFPCLCSEAVCVFLKLSLRNPSDLLEGENAAMPSPDKPSRAQPQLTVTFFLLYRFHRGGKREEKAEGGMFSLGRMKMRPSLKMRKRGCF